MKKQIFTLFFLFFLIKTTFFAQNNIVSYVGGNGAESFNDVTQLSNGTFLIAGNASDLTWLNNSVSKSQLPSKGINNTQGTNQYGFLMQLSSDFKTIQNFVYFPQNAVENIRFIKSTNQKGASTGDLFISGDTKDSRANGGGYFIAKLNKNFINGIPTDLLWVKNVWAEGYVKETHPWDVGNDGKVVYITGQSHAADWAAMHRTDKNGNDEVVENFRTHWKINNGGEYYGTASSVAGGIQNLTYSGMVLKNGNRCNFRSWTTADFEALLPDGNGSKKKGTWPLDVFFNSPCTPGTGPSNGPGYTGYKMGGSQVWGASSIVIDRRDNHFYLGLNIQSVLPDGNPDFEPAVMAFDQNGKLKWWSRLYHEIAPNTSDKYLNSTPDQYIDGLAIDQSGNNLVVNARCHGNNTENFWEGNTVAAIPLAAGFQNNFTGSSGNIHISWLGKLQLSSGTLQRSTYVAEYAEAATGLGKPLTDVNMENWPNPNDGWATVNTTRLTKNTLKTTADGSVIVLGVGRRVMTTQNAFQKMPLPSSAQKSAWSEFVRVYKPDFSAPLYSSLLTGDWDKINETGGDNTDLQGVWKVQDGVVVVGKTKGSGNEIPTSNVPSWGTNKQNGQDALIAYLSAKNLENKADGVSTTAVADIEKNTNFDFDIFPNPLTDNVLYLKNKEIVRVEKVSVFSITGQMLHQQFFDQENQIFKLELPSLTSGFYFLKIENEKQTFTGKFFVKK
jgi:hypothetical protein